MNFLFIGGTGTISREVTFQAAAAGHDVTLINRGTHPENFPANVRTLRADINDENTVSAALGASRFDAVVDFIAYVPENLQRDYRLFRGRCGQFIFISSASAYQKPPRDFPISESTPLDNPFWEYSQNKIRCEEYLRSIDDKDFPYTIVRPSHTFGDRKVPVGLHGKKGSWQVLRRILDGKPVIIHGDGQSLWTLTYAGDFAKGFCGLLGNPAALGEAVHITTDEARSWLYIYQTIAAALGRELKPRFVTTAALAAAGREYDFRGSLWGDKANTAIFDNRKLKRLVPDFSARITIAEGLLRAVKYTLAHPELQVPDPEFDDWCDRIGERFGAE